MSEFEPVSDETRLGILRELAARLRESPDDPTIGFSDLRRRVGVRDSGNFNYHLQRLTGRFVTKTPDGYRIAAAGVRVVAAVVSGTYGEGTRLGPERIEDPCPVCGAALRASYADGMVRVTCAADDDHRFRTPLPPGAVEERMLAEVLDLVARKTWQETTLAADGICPMCYGRVPWEVEQPREGDLAEFADQCPRCGARFELPAVVPLSTAPTAVAFFDDHGTRLHDQPLWAEAFAAPVSIDTADESPRFTITVRLDDERLRAAVDRSLDVHCVRRESVD